MKLQNFALGRWQEGSGDGQMLYDASTGEEVAWLVAMAWILLRCWNMVAM